MLADLELIVLDVYLLIDINYPWFGKRWWNPEDHYGHTLVRYCHIDFCNWLRMENVANL